MISLSYGDKGSYSSRTSLLLFKINLEKSSSNEDGKEILAKPQAKILLSGVTINERLIS